MKFSLTMVASLCLLSPALTFASACTDVINQIHEDIANYGEAINQQHLAWMNLSWLQTTLGTASMDRLKTANVRYSWRCDSEIFLNMIVDQQGNLRSVQGQYTTRDGSGLFYSPLNQPNFLSAAQPVQHTQPAPIAINPAPIQRDTLNPNAIITYAQYYGYLRECTPGTYRYTMSIMNTPVYPKSTIYGRQLGRCVVETSYFTPRAEKMLIKCQYKAQSLSHFTDDAAVQAERGNIGYNRAIMKNECQAFLNGNELKHL